MAKRMRWAARVIGLIAAASCLIVLSASSIADALTGRWQAMPQADIITGALIGILGAIGLAGCILSWWRERLASILLILTSLGFGIHIGIFAGHNHFNAWLIIGSPYLIAGMLLLYSWQLSRKTP